MKLFVTGICGFVGSSLASWFHEHRPSFKISGIEAVRGNRSNITFSEPHDEMPSTVDFEETFGQTCPLSLPCWKYFTDRQSCQDADAVLGVRLRRTLCHLIIDPAIGGFQPIA